MNQLPHILIFIAGFLWGIELIPQLIKTYKTKSTKDISTLFFSICMLAYILYIIANVMLKNWSIVIAHIPSLVGNLCMLIMLYIYE